MRPGVFRRTVPRRRREGDACGGTYRRVSTHVRHACGRQIVSAGLDAAVGPERRHFPRFRLRLPTEVDRVFGVLVAAGAPVHLEPFDAFWGQRYASVADPDGNAVELYAALPPA
ncbi:VOC family protein [Gordonia effusa]|uniref:VOC family protein n=1 Tax=Gordonia effusa TaxID=263908 RepID=UPI00357119AA